jgi:hypothetical protein
LKGRVFCFLKEIMTKKKKRAAIDARERINVLALIEALEQHVLGEKEMKPTQVSAALALLKKILPDIADPAKKTSGETGIVSYEDALRELE